MKAPSPTSAVALRRHRLDRRLHKIYFRAAGIHHGLARRCRPAGITLLLVLVLATCLGFGHDRTSIYYLFSLTLGMLVIAIPWAMSRCPTIEASRELPKFATAGEPLRYIVRVWRLDSKPLSHAWLSDTPPDPRPNIADFTTLREPGEEERNGFDRYFAYYRWQWLLLENRSFSGGFSKDPFDIKRGQQARVTMQITPLRRGVIRFDDLRVLLPDPFGLFQRCRTIKTSSSNLTVLPRRYPLPPIELPGDAAFKISGEANTNSIGNSGELVGLRDYLPGDPLRQIHWKSWARTGRPIVKELEDTFYPRYGLIVDTLSCGRGDHQFEEVISVAASFASSIDTHESLLDLMFIKNEAHLVTAGRRLERVEKLLEVLAEVSPERKENFKALAQLVMRHRENLTSCVVIFNGWDETRAEFLKTLTRGGVVCASIIIGKGPIPTVGAPGHWLQSDHIARDLLRLPTRLLS